MNRLSGTLGWISLAALENLGDILEMASTISGLNLDALITLLTAEIEKQGGSVDASGEVAPTFQNEPLTDPGERQAAGSQMISDLLDLIPCPSRS